MYYSEFIKKWNDYEISLNRTNGILSDYDIDVIVSDYWDTDRVLCNTLSKKNALENAVINDTPSSLPDSFIYKSESGEHHAIANSKQLIFNVYSLTLMVNSGIITVEELVRINTLLNNNKIVESRRTSLFS